MLDEKKVCELAKTLGFHDAAFMDVKDLVIKPEYRKYCEMNLCHQYGVNPACPPMSGTVEEMDARILAFNRALVLQTVHDHSDDPTVLMKAKKSNNGMADQLLDQLDAEDTAEILRMSAGPWHKHSCMSAYCVDAQCMADSVNMTCWGNDGKIRYFSVILFK